MKIMLDTNVLISAFIFGGRAGKLLKRLFESEHELYVSDYVNQEFKAKLDMKWPDKAKRVYELFHVMDFHFCESTETQMGNLRDVKDVPVLSDALYHKMDMILTGDKDFLEANLDHPLIFSPGMLYDFLEQYEQNI